MAIKKDTLDQLLSGRDPKEVFSKDGLFDELKKALAERVLIAELDDHLDGEAAAGKYNHRNGYPRPTPKRSSGRLSKKPLKETPTSAERLTTLRSSGTAPTRKKKPAPRPGPIPAPIV